MKQNDQIPRSHTIDRDQAIPGLKAKLFTDGAGLNALDHSSSRRRGRWISVEGDAIAGFIPHRPSGRLIPVWGS